MNAGDDLGVVGLDERGAGRSRNGGRSQHEPKVFRFIDDSLECAQLLDGLLRSDAGAGIEDYVYQRAGIAVDDCGRNHD